VILSFLNIYMVGFELEEKNPRDKCLQHFVVSIFFVFLFENKVDRDMIFRSVPYFMGARGMYLNKWTSYFSPENGIPSVVLVWVRLPFPPPLPLHCWNDETLKNIGNTLGRYID
jgi:hypothetical protein